MVEGTLRPSSDTPTHLELYRAFPAIGGVVHTHSEYATAFAQARNPIRCMGTTHADYFRGDIPVTRPMTQEEVERDYERNTGLVIVEALREAGAADADAARYWSPTTGLSRGALTPRPPSSAPRCSSTSRALEWRVRALNPDAPRPDSFSSTSTSAASTAPRRITGRNLRVAGTFGASHLWPTRSRGWQNLRGNRSPVRIGSLEYDQSRRFVGSRRDARRFRGVSLAVVARHDARGGDRADLRAVPGAASASATIGFSRTWLPAADPDRAQRHRGRKGSRVPPPRPDPRPQTAARRPRVAGRPARGRLEAVDRLVRPAPERRHDAAGARARVSASTRSSRPRTSRSASPTPRCSCKPRRSSAIPPARCIVVEDAAAGVEGGRRGGMRTIGVTRNGTLDADVFVRSLEDLPPDAFERLLGEASG